MDGGFVRSCREGNYSRPDIDLRTGDQVRVGQLYRVDSGDTLYNVADRFSSTVPILYGILRPSPRSLSAVFLYLTQ
eukprot:749908-Hanusia_phi.AAC.2